MKPGLRSRHFLAVTVLAAVSTLYARLALDDYRMSPAQMGIAAAALKDNDRSLFPRDPVFGSSSMWQMHSPLFQGVLRLWLVPHSYDDVTMPFRAMAGVMTMLYLCGMYALLFRQCLSWSVSLFVAVLSSAVIWGPGRWQWGLGSLGSVTPEGLCCAMIPLVILAFLRYARQWQVLLVFGFVGLMGNLHLVTAVNLTLILAIVHLGRERFAVRAWPTALVCVVCAGVGMLPYAAYYFAQRQAVSPAGVSANYAAARQALEAAGLKVLYPGLLKPLTNFLPFCVILAVPAGAILFRAERFRARQLRCWVWFILAALLVGLAVHGASQLIGKLQDRPPVMIDFVQALSMILLPLYVLLAQSLTNLFRLTTKMRMWLRWGCVALMAIWMIPSDNVRPVRYAAADMATGFMAEADKPEYVRRHHGRRSEYDEMKQIARWSRQVTNTDRDAVFVADSILLRMLARRTIVSSGHDVRYHYYLRPWGLKAWAGDVDRLDHLLGSRGPAQGQGLAEYVRELASRDQFSRARQWYVVLDTRGQYLLVPGASEVLSGEWGEHYRLFRLPAPAVAGKQ